MKKIVVLYYICKAEEETDMLCMRGKITPVFLLLLSFVISNCLSGCTSGKPDNAEPSLSVESIFPDLTNTPGVITDTGSDPALDKEVPPDGAGLNESNSEFGLSYNLTIEEFRESFRVFAKTRGSAIYEHNMFSTSAVADHIPYYWDEKLPNGICKYICSPGTGDVVLTVYSFEDCIIGAYITAPVERERWGSYGENSEWMEPAVKLLMALDNCDFDTAYIRLRNLLYNMSVYGEYDNGRQYIANVLYANDGTADIVAFGEFASVVPISDGIQGVLKMTGELDDSMTLNMEAPDWSFRFHGSSGAEAEGEPYIFGDWNKPQPGSFDEKIVRLTNTIMAQDIYQDENGNGISLAEILYDMTDKKDHVCVTYCLDSTGGREERYGRIDMFSNLKRSPDEELPAEFLGLSIYFDYVNMEWSPDKSDFSDSFGKPLRDDVFDEYFRSDIFTKDFFAEYADTMLKTLPVTERGSIIAVKK